MANASRRSFLVSATSVAVAGGGPALAFARGTPEIDRLWTAILEARAKGVAISREIEETEARLPWWAAVGRRYLVAEGAPERPETSGSPAIQGLARPSSGAFKLIRPAPMDIEEHFKLTVRIWGDEKRARVVYDRSMAEYRERRDAQDHEREKLGLSAMEARQEANDNIVFAAEKEIDALAPSANVIAARVLLAMVMDVLRYETFEYGGQAAAVAALTGLRGLLSGPVAATAADYLDNPTRPFCFSPLWGSYWPADKNPRDDA